MENDNYEIVSHVAINTTLAAAAGTVTALFIDAAFQEHNTGEVTFNLSYAMNGCLAGLVSITAGCAVVQSWAALLIGAIGGALFLGCSKLLVKRRIDDAVDAVPVHVSLGCIHRPDLPLHRALFILTVACLT
jgi:Amt family ammonium transporter